MTILSAWKAFARMLGAVVLVGTLSACGGMTSTDSTEQSPPSDIEVTTGTTDGMDDDWEEDTQNGDAQDNKQADLDGVMVVCPDDWIVAGETEDSIALAQTPGEGTIDLVLRPTSDLMPDAQGWAESVASTTGVAGTSETYEVNGVTWYGVIPGDASFILYADSTTEEGIVVSVTGEGISLEDAMTMLEGITLS